MSVLKRLVSLKVKCLFLSPLLISVKIILQYEAINVESLIISINYNSSAELF